MENDSYRRLVQHFAAVQDLNSAANTLDWYARTKAPEAAQPGLGSQIATLRKQAHELLVSPKSADDLAAAEACQPWEAANLREMRRRHRLAAALRPISWRPRRWRLPSPAGLGEGEAGRGLCGVSAGPAGVSRARSRPGSDTGQGPRAVTLRCVVGGARSGPAERRHSEDVRRIVIGLAGHG